MGTWAVDSMAARYIKGFYDSLLLLPIIILLFSFMTVLLNAYNLMVVNFRFGPLCWLPSLLSLNN